MCSLFIFILRIILGDFFLGGVTIYQVYRNKTYGPSKIVHLEDVSRIKGAGNMVPTTVYRLDQTPLRSKKFI